MATNRRGNENITHFWLEIEDTVIDITGDQYNLIESKNLNDVIVESRPFLPVHVEPRGNSLLYQLFDISYRYDFESSFSNTNSSYLHSMKFGYSQLLNQG